MSSVLYKPVRYLLGATRCAVKAPAHDLEDWRLTWNMPIDGGPLAPKEIRIKIDLEAVLQPEAATQRNAPPAGLPVNIEQTCSNRANHAGQAGRVKGVGAPAIPRTSPQIERTSSVIHHPGGGRARTARSVGRRLRHRSSKSFRRAEADPHAAQPARFPVDGGRGRPRRAFADPHGAPSPPSSSPPPPPCPAGAGRGHPTATSADHGTPGDR